MSSNLVKKFYQDVLEQLFEQSSVLWEEEGLEDSSMADLRQLWESKLAENGIDLSREGVGGQDQHEPAPAKASGRSAKAKNNNASVGAAGGAASNSGRKVRTSPQAVQQEPEPPAPVLPAQPQIAQVQAAVTSFHTNEPPQLIRHTAQQQQQQNTAVHSLQQQQQLQGRPQHVVSHNQNPSGIQGIGLLPYSVPFVGPLVHISSSKVSDASVLPASFTQRHLSLHNQTGSMPASGQSGISVQQLLQLNNAGNQLRMGNAGQNMEQHNNQSQRLSDRISVPSMAPPSVSLEERHRLLNHIQNNMFRTGQQQQNIVMGNRMAVQQQNVPQKFCQQNGVPGNQQFSGQQYTNVNSLFMANQFPFQQPVGNQSSVIHVADSSGNQSALLLPVMMRPVSDNGSNAGNPPGRGGGNVRKPGQSLPLQLDGHDDDDDDDIFQDLSDDDDTASKTTLTPRPAKKQKTGDRKDATERLEEEDLDSEDDDDNDDNTANVVDVVDNVVVCQYEKIGRTRNKWKLQLKSGMCSLNGKEYIFHKATGDAEF